MCVYTVYICDMYVYKFMIYYENTIILNIYCLEWMLDPVLGSNQIIILDPTHTTGNSWCSVALPHMHIAQGIMVLCKPRIFP